MNYLDQMLFWFIMHPELVGLGCLAIIGWRMHHRVKKLEAPAAVQYFEEDAAGLVRINADYFELLRSEYGQVVPIDKLPEPLHAKVRRASFKLMSRWLLDQVLYDKEDADDQQRIMSVMAAIYKTPLPKCLMTLDRRALQFYDRVRIDLAFTRVQMESFKHYDDATMRRFDPDRLLAMREQFTQMSELVYSFLIVEKSFPYFCHFRERYHHNFYQGARALKVQLNDDELRALVTVYSALTQIAIPQSYVLLNPLSSALLRMDYEEAVEERHQHRHLRVVK